jgi:hypothetical protein
MSSIETLMARHVRAIQDIIKQTGAAPAQYEIDDIAEWLALRDDVAAYQNYWSYPLVCAPLDVQNFLLCGVPVVVSP